MVRVYDDGTELRAQMSKGPGCFAVATFADEPPIATELPNIMLEALPTAKGRKPKAPGIRRKPARAPARKAMKKAAVEPQDLEMEGEESEEEEAKEEDVEVSGSEGDSNQYTSAHYAVKGNRKVHYCGVREKSGLRRQVMSITLATFAREKLEAVCLEAGRRLSKGQSVDVVKAWLRSHKSKP